MTENIEISPIEQIAALTDATLASAAAPIPQPDLVEVPEDFADDGSDDVLPPEIDAEELRRIDMDVVRANTGEPQNDTGNGQRLLRYFGGELLNVREMATEKEAAWHYYDGKRWQRDGGNELALLRAQRVAPRIQLEADFITATPGEQSDIARGEDARLEKSALDGKPRDQWTDADKRRMIELERLIMAGGEAEAALKKRQVARRKFAVSSGNGARLREMLKQALPHKTVTLAELDQDAMAFNCANGTLRFVDYEVPDLDCPDPDVDRRQTLWVARLDPHDPADLVSKMSPVDYRPDAPAPKFLASIERFQPNPRVRRWLQKYYGYALTGKTGEQCIVLNVGAGGNWKSTFIEIVCRVVGEYAEMLKWESLAEKGETTGAQANPDFARLPGKRLVRVTDPDYDMKLKEGLVKSLTSGEPWITRHNFGNFFTFYPWFKLALSSNHKPEIGGGDRGIWRRIRFVPWLVSISDAEQRDMEEVLAELWQEREGILAWLVEGLMLYLHEGLKPPPEIVDATAEYQEEMDPVGSFIAACVTRLSPQENTTPPLVAATEMYDAFDRWCSANNVRAWKQKAFGSVLSQKGIVRDRTAKVRGYSWVLLHDVPARVSRREEPPHPAVSDEEISV